MPTSLPTSTQNERERRQPWPIFSVLRERLLSVDDWRVIDDHILGLIQAAIEAGHAISRQYGAVSTQVKADRTHITRADTLADTIIREHLTANPTFKGFSYIDEEAPEIVAGTNCLVIDPIDGTTNYALSIPYYSISIGILDATGPTHGVVYSPSTKELYLAARGKGSFLADVSVNPRDVELVQLRVPRAPRRAREEHLERGLHSFCHGGNAGAIERMIRIYKSMKLRNPKYRQFGCASLELCYVARGRVESFNMTGVNLWDVAAGCVIASEAGARITDFDGKTFTKTATDLLAAEPGIHGSLLAFIKGCMG